MTAQSPERTARIALRESIVAHQRAVQQVEQCEDVLAKANALCESLTEQAAEFSTLDADISHARADKLKLALAVGDHSLPDDDNSEFASRIIARDNVADHLRRVQSSIPVLESELAQAEDDVKRCELVREHAAEQVFCAEAEKLASDYIAQLNALRRTSYILNMMHAKQVRRASNDAGTPSSHLIYGSGPYRKVKTSAIVDDAVQENIIGFHEQKHGFGLRHQSGAQVADFWERLQQDPNAMLDDEEQHNEAAE